MLTHDSIDIEQAVELERQWSSSRAGVVLRNPVGVRYAAPQLRSAYATPSALLEPHVRQGLAYAIDRQALADTEEALSRLASGRYGLCEGCTAAIPARLLAAAPETRYCPRCRPRPVLAPGRTLQTWTVRAR